jgi:hypothetical protein
MHGPIHKQAAVVMLAMSADAQLTVRNRIHSFLVPPLRVLCNCSYTPKTHPAYVKTHHREVLVACSYVGDIQVQGEKNHGKLPVIKSGRRLCCLHHNIVELIL